MSFHGVVENFISEYQMDMAMESMSGPIGSLYCVSESYVDELDNSVIALESASGTSNPFKRAFEKIKAGKAKEGKAEADKIIDDLKSDVENAEDEKRIKRLKAIIILGVVALIALIAFFLAQMRSNKKEYESLLATATTNKTVQEQLEKDLETARYSLKEAKGKITDLKKERNNLLQILASSKNAISNVTNCVNSTNN